jgi:hypothetical protein
MARLKIAAHWDPRRESVRACAGRLHDFLTGLAAFADVFSRWCRKGASRRAANLEVDFRDREALRLLLESGRNRRDSDNAAIEELGFRVALWNCQDEPRSVGLSITCGLYSASPHLRNYVVLDLPGELGGLREDERIADLMSVVATSWDPEWAAAFSNEARDQQAGTSQASPVVDWALYLSEAVNGSVPLPHIRYSRVLEDRGRVIVFTDGPSRVT